MLPLFKFAAACSSGLLGLGIGCYMGSNLRSAENAAAPMPHTAIIPATPKHSTAGEISLTGVPQLPSTMPSAAAALQWAGWPGFDNIRFRDGYVSSYNRQTRNPNWVCQHLCKETLTGDANRKKAANFAEDSFDPPHMRGRLADFKDSGYDRGHLVAAADAKFSQDAMDQTFLLSNISPQVGEGFNRGYWERMERWCRNLIHQGTYSDLFVITGPLFLPSKESDGKYYMQHRVLGNPPMVHVPTHFFKIILALPSRNAQDTLTLGPSPPPSSGGEVQGALVPANSWRAPERPIALGAFVVPNQKIEDGTDLKKYEVPIELVERYSGLLFFPRVPRQATKFVAPLCTATKCQLPPPFQKGGGGGGGKGKGGGDSGRIKVIA